ncbi:aquaporin-5-like [Symsagittifera roscoffensis]|uniref:aquaporin-5-like n=1 Tax=Symsagittifera roscoffensis TaxID=84072 RepID=UPI00307B221A
MGREGFPFKDYSLGTEDIRNFHFWKGVIGEGIATMFLVLSVLTGGTYGTGTAPAYGYALAFGFSVLTLVYAFNDISGGHINNAVSFALFLMGRCSLIRCLCYTAAQVGGAALGAFIAQGVHGGDESWGCGIVARNENVSRLWTLVLEIIFTALLILVVLVATEAERSRSERALHIGLCVFICHVVIMPYTGCAINPARATGPAIVCGELKDIWIYWITGYAGSFLGCVIYWFLSYWSR